MTGPARRTGTPTPTRPREPAAPRTLTSPRALTGRAESYYSDHRGTPQEFISAAKYGYLFQGQRYAWQKKPRGTRADGIAPAAFVNFLENHDQVANSVNGARLHVLTAPGRLRAMTALLLLKPVNATFP